MISLLLFSLLASNVRSQCSSDPFTFNSLTAKCFDGTNAGYYSIDVAGSDDVIIWLGDSDLCGSQSECQDLCDGVTSSGDNLCSDPNAFTQDAASIEDLKNCFYASLTCGSSNWDKTSLCPETILSEFTSFNRIFVPQCTFDMFLGTQSSVFNGFSIFSEMITALRNNGQLTSGSKVIIGGNRGGGIGALNLASFVAATAGVTDIKIIADSSWFVSLPEFTGEDFGKSNIIYKAHSILKANVNAWITNARLDTNCKAFFTGVNNEDEAPFVNCLYSSELITSSEFLRSIPILFVQSQYDIATLADNGVLEEDNQDKFPDTSAFTTNAIKYIEEVGSTIRLTVQEAFDDASRSVDSSPHQFFLDSCFDHGSLVPASTLLISPREEIIGNAGTVLVDRTNKTWENLKINDQSLKSVVTSFVNSASVSSELIVERCGTFMCSESCTGDVDISLAVVELNTNTASHVFIIGIALIMIAGGWAGFILIYLRVLAFRRTTKVMWSKVDMVEGGRDSRKASKDTITLDIGGATEVKEENDGSNEFIEEVSKRTNIVSLMVTNVSYLAPARVPGGDEHQILKNVSLSAKPMEVHALMGPSGSGKTTLLDILAANRENGTLKGIHYINGVPSHLKRSEFLKDWLKHNLSYVRQQDVLFPNLTVRQHLTHAAWLMLPESMKPSDKIRRVWQVVKLLRLEQTLDTKIGDGGVRIEGGISGGERRRVSVATQLLKSPTALVLDEPTSGLDSSNALLLVHVLKKLAHEGKICILLTIHQPRREIFELLDRLTILLEGQIMFSGSPQDASKFFRMRLDEVNIGDDILDKLEEYKTNEQGLRAIRRRYIEGRLGRNENERIIAEQSFLTKEMSALLKKRLKVSSKSDGRISWEKVTSHWLAIYVLLSRTIYRGGFDIERTAFTSLIGGILVGTVFLGNDSYTQSAALAYLMVATMTFLQSTFLGTRYQLEKGMWSHEKDAGTNVSWLAFLGSLYLRNIVTSTIEGLAFAVPAYFMGNLNTDKPERFILFMILLVLVAIAVISQNTFIEIDRIRRGGVSGPDLRQAALINMSLLSLGALFNGFIIRLADIPNFLSWVPYCMVTFWGFVGILVNNFRDFSFPCDAAVLECASRTGDAFIKEFRYDQFDVFEAIVALTMIIVLYHVAGTLDFFIRFVLQKSTLKLEDTKQDQWRTFTENEIKNGCVGETMHQLVNVNIPQSMSKRIESRSKSKSKSRLALRSNSKNSLTTNNSKGSKGSKPEAGPSGSSTRINVFVPTENGHVTI